MKNYLLTVMFLALSLTIYSQTLEETTNWIEENATAPNSMFTNTIFYDIQSHKLLLCKNYAAPFKFRKITEIDPAQVSSISLDENSKNSGLRSIVLNLKDGASNTRTYLANYNSTVSKSNKIEEKQMASIPILAEGNLDHAKKIKLAYINLFQQLGVNVKDGDTF